MSGLVSISGSDAGISAALRARKVIAMHAVRISCSLPGATTNRSRSRFFAELLACVKATYLWLMQIFDE